MPEDGTYNLNMPFHKDRNVVEVNVAPAGETPTCHINLPPDVVSQVIDRLADYRAAMTPPIGGDRPPAGPVKAVLDPKWWVQPEPLTEGMAIALLHPGLGWISFVIPPAELEKLKTYVDGNLARAKSIAPARAN